MRVLRKLEDETELLGCDIDVEVKTISDSEGKTLKDNEIEIIGSTASMDRDGESIAIEAWDLKSFKKNPIILPQHDYSKPAIGKATNIKVQDNKLVFKIEFPEDGANPEADIYRKLYKSGFMNASSVGFIPKEWVDGDGKKSPYRKFTKVELLELSLVSVPANSEATVIGRSLVSKGIVSEAELKSVGYELKGSDPYAVVTGEYDERIASIESDISNIVNRLTFVEGFIAGIQKNNQQQEAKSYISDVLTCASKSTEKLKQEISDLIKKI